jgi:type IV pilus assembly protein PilE
MNGPNPSNRPFWQRGMTLIELMIVVVVVAILASIAVPSYRNYVLRTHRTEAKSALLALAAQQEKFYVQNNTYADNGVLSTAPPNGLGIPASTDNGWYTISITAADAETFTAMATAAGGQLEDTDCATMTVTALGVKTATKQGGGASTVCWN